MGKTHASAETICKHSYARLAIKLDPLIKLFPGRVGIAVHKQGCDSIWGVRQQEYMPQQSVSKLWVALSVFDAVDRGAITLGDRVTLSREDLVVFNQPLRAAVLAHGVLHISVGQLLEDELVRSDNLANNRLLRLVGGPSAVREVLVRKHLDYIRFGPGERLLQSRIAGLTWRSDYVFGRNFYAARDRIPLAKRATALRAYLANPVDGAEPEALASALARLSKGRLLSSRSTAAMMAILAHTHSGPRRLKGGLRPGWAIWHKTGTGQILGATATGYNDVAVLRSPNGALYTLAVMIAETQAPIIARMTLMQKVTRAICDTDHAQAGTQTRTQAVFGKGGAE